MFSDFPIEDQAIVLEFLQEIHRMAKRRAPKPNGAPQPVATLLDDQPDVEAIR